MVDDVEADALEKTRPKRARKAKGVAKVVCQVPEAKDTAVSLAAAVPPAKRSRRDALPPMVTGAADLRQKLAGFQLPKL